MTPYELSMLSKPLADLYTQLESDLIQNIAEYLAEQNLDCSTAKWKIKALANLGKLDKKNIEQISKYAGIAPEMLEIALTNAAYSAINELEPGFRKLAKKGLIEAAKVPIEDSMANALKAYSKQASEQLNLVNTVMKYKARTAASKLIKDTAELSNKQSFLNMLNKATGKAVTGIESRQAALRQCIHEMMEKGIPCFTDKRGREWSPEAYINMDIRTTCGNVAHQAQFQRMDDYGTTLIEVSSHIGARPRCEPFQGRIFDRTNKSAKYPHWSSTSYGEPAGLLGINCGHQVYPYIEGISSQTYFPYDKDENDKQYKLTQQQRQLERNVRRYKRECSSLDALGDQEGFKKASVKLKQQRSKLKSFCNNNGLTYKADRTAVVGYSKNRNPLDNVKKSSIIKSNEIIGKSLGAAAKNYPVRLPDGNHTKFAEGSTISKIKVFAGSGTNVPIREAIILESDYKIPADKWQKVRGEGVIVFEGKNRTAELHWYEAEGTKVKVKVKRWLDES